MTEGVSSHEKGESGEEFVSTLMEINYLSYWCYPNPKDTYGDKKEICDLLILFSNYAFIISVKNYRFDGNHERYFRKTIDKAIKQVQGAERKLFNTTNPIYIEHPKKGIEKFHPKKYTKIHRIIVNLGGDVDYYSVGMPDKNGNFVHIFDRETVSVLINELDTIPDLVEYLVKREELMTSYEKLILKGTEKDLLSTLITNKRDFPEKFKSINSANAHLELDGAWLRYVSHDDVYHKQEANKVSYFIDELVENEILILPDKETRDLIATEFMSLNRLQRRIISKAMIDFMKHYLNMEKALFRREFTVDGCESHFIIVSMPKNTPRVDETMRMKIAENVMEIAIWGSAMQHSYKMKSYVGMCFFPWHNPVFFYVPIEPLSKEGEAQILYDIKKMGWFQNVQFNFDVENEFPRLLNEQELQKKEEEYKVKFKDYRGLKRFKRFKD